MESLLLIPDITGFTRFINETESVHGRHIVAELLEIIIDADELDLTVAEIEGDAVLFYRENRVPSVAEISRQAERMFLRFHEHLKLYESRRICRCGACVSAQSLTLKIIAHAGPIEFIQVKDFSKPFGPDVILTHRLLKNDVPADEYVLVTESIAGPGDGETGDLPDWVAFRRAESRYEEAGLVRYRYADMASLVARVPKPVGVEDFERIGHPVSRSIHIDQPVAETYELISNLTQRLEFTEGPDEIKFEADRVNRIGTRHQCVVRGDLLEFETVTADFGPQKLVYGERLKNPPLLRELTSYTVLESQGNGTLVRIELHYRKKPFPASLLTPIFRLGAARRLTRQLSRMKVVAESADEGNPRAGAP